MKRIRPTRRLVASLALAGLIALLPAQLLALPRKGQPAPAFKVVTTSGQAVSLSNYQGYVLVVDFFATWCEPCRMSIPHLVKMNQKYGKQGLQILGLSADEDGPLVVKSFAAEHHMNYPVALAGDTTEDFGVRSVPVMIVIDKKGKVSEVFRGFSDEIADSMESLIKKLLAEK
ncbi:TlpA disulfide reductase family protein [Geobacter sp. AOG2]|uniref:TlpA family protein disulfide reductase n=1 Tax=Geobacter sp. AOG2 TaxID=1566347 RepID=UPI001CC46C13|nr:TlpA disulfide reductase family protein [Geobacter sp. AOG2]GFE59436.1 thioredoxin [Geobacter sp. AOG2]